MPDNRLPLERPLSQIDRSEQWLDERQPLTSSFSFQQSQKRLKKVELLIEAGDNIGAKSQADAINPLDLSAEQQTLLNLLNAQILLGSGDAESAVKRLDTILPEQLDLPHKIEYFQSQAFAYSLMSNPLESAKARIKLQDFLASPQQLEENQSAILESLVLLPDSELENYGIPATDSLAGWLSLARLLKSKGQPGFYERADQWRENYQGHPANAAFLENIQETAEPNSGPPRSIALFLPEAGPFTQAGKAVRAGFLAAYNVQGSNGYKPVIHFYDSERATALIIYNQAISDGAEFMIGPLQKENIQSLADSVTLSVPVLALNHVPGLWKDKLYQFGLSPMDDVEDVTHKAWLDDHRNALMLVPDNAQGSRMAGYFQSDWQALGGHMLETQTYQPNETDFSAPIKKLLNLDESEFRYNKISELIPGLKFAPRRRQDADVLLLNANSSEARSINPQLQYYQAKPLPVYATPGVYSGQVNASLDADLDGITFCDSPWLLDKSYGGALSMNALKETWQSFPDAYLRLVAMGIDAYDLINRIKTLDVSSFAGATGRLSLANENRIKRSLSCAKFAAGHPVMTEPVGATADYIENHEAAPSDSQPVQSSQPTDHVAE